ncbi:MAG TPA: non-homologous end-joining DNA ligase [Vicinamibacterales bacterium]|nr:non-homologous end-joining DNA ligase [Vicinamibacterales bacterium]
MPIAPMLATLVDAPLTSPGLLYEPKYDGIRAIAEIEPARGAPRVRLWSRLGNEKTAQFPSVVRALQTLGVHGRRLVVDGEIVALDAAGRPTGFQRLQSRIHLSDAHDVARTERAQPVAYIAFDLLCDGDRDLRGAMLTERRQQLESLLEGRTDAVLRLSEQAAGDGRALHARARAEGWEGLIAKEARSVYQSGRRSPTWRKIKLLKQQEFVIGGWTEPRQTRQYFGALLLGVHEPGNPGDRLTYVGHTGTGFDGAELRRVWTLLASRATDRSPFTERIKSNEPAHWVRPELVAQVRFTEWTDDNKLRHPVYLGLRDDKAAAEVVRETPVPPRASRAAAERDDTGAARASDHSTGGAGPGRPRAVSVVLPSRPAAASATGRAQPTRRSTARGGRRPTGEARRSRAERIPTPADAAVVEQLRALEAARNDGTIVLPDGSRLGVTNLSKLFWPKLKLTKGDLLRYYATVAPLILPAVEDRPLVMKRFPNGVDGPAFYQQRSRQEQPPREVRIETLPADIEPISEPDARRFIGGSLITLLYMTQLAAISQDPWFSRVQSPLEVDYVALDLDPGDGATFARVLDVARWVRDELASLKVPGVPKTSGSSGLHIYIPMPPGTSYESGVLFCQIVATVVAAHHPKVATVERKVKARGKGTVYVDYLQNILGKTLATAYSARASAFAGVSTPLTWDEVDAGVDPRDFTIVTAPARFAEVGDLWKRLRASKPASLEAVFRKYAR